MIMLEGTLCNFGTPRLEGEPPKKWLVHAMVLRRYVSLRYLNGEISMVTSGDEMGLFTLKKFAAEIQK
jgi:hypothetical protein